MLTGIDISNWQKGFSLSATKPGFCIVKATEGINFVDKCCDSFVQQCIKLGIPWGYYHFARTNGGAKEARYFYSQTKNYTGKGIPVLDFEDTRNANSYIDEFVKEYHAITGIYPWVYMNSDFVNNRGYGSDFVKKNCGLWLAGYPSNMTTYPAGKECPYKHTGWTLAAWQFTSSLRLGGMSVDGDIFYGDTSAWDMYATGGGASGSVAAGGSATSQTATKSDAPSGSAASDLSQFSDYQLARKVINGEYGNGAERRAVLGSRYDAVQSAVNLLLTGSDTALAKAVIAGKCGNGSERKTILGSRYNAVQKKVNSLLS